MSIKDMEEHFKNSNWTSRDENYTSQMKITMNRINRKLDIAEEKINKLEAKPSGTIQRETQQKKKGGGQKYNC